MHHTDCRRWLKRLLLIRGHHINKTKKNQLHYVLYIYLLRENFAKAFYQIEAMLTIPSTRKMWGICLFSNNGSAQVNKKTWGWFHNLFCALFAPYAKHLRPKIASQKLGVGCKTVMKSTLQLLNLCGSYPGKPLTEPPKKYVVAIVNSSVGRAGAP